VIELTQEQWQAVTREENPLAIEPESKTAYVVIRKDEYEKLRIAAGTEPDAAYVLRIAWMRRMRLDEDEIAESIRDDPPLNVHDEMKQLKALDSLERNTPPAEVFRKYAIKY
jgi:hypothetical protein